MLNGKRRRTTCDDARAPSAEAGSSQLIYSISKSRATGDNRPASALGGKRRPRADAPTRRWRTVHENSHSQARGCRRCGGAGSGGAGRGANPSGNHLCAALQEPAGLAGAHRRGDGAVRQARASAEVQLCRFNLGHRDGAALRLGRFRHHRHQRAHRGGGARPASDHRRQPLQRFGRRAGAVQGGGRQARRQARRAARRPVEGGQRPVDRLDQQGLLLHGLL